MNKPITGLLLGLLSFFYEIPTTLSANSLNVEFSGELIRTACQVSSESLNQKIPLYNLNSKFINEHKTSAVTPFSISIEKCSSTDLQKQIKITWESNQLVNVSGHEFVVTQGDSNILLGVIDNDEKPIIWNKPTTVDTVSVVENTQQIGFGVFVRKPATGEAKIGDFSGIVTFKVDYE
ncbi:fimbrial protein [Providencia sp.]|uniref:fimbrial protein n=1 Tax=Providencia sp. TaxID=589 RepID=UPI000E970D7E|nr:type 1 fimbrial protein [Providencia sp.]HBO23151.1 type 1 fimbrial protein [Providencia sp.]